MSFKKWDIIYISRFPESIPCKKCKKHFMIANHRCSYCQTLNNVSSIIAKIRPAILWIDQSRWFESMSFAIPLSTSRPEIVRTYDEPIALSQYSFLHKNIKFHRPMRAVIHQATRIDGCVLQAPWLLGKITDVVVQKKIEDKLFNWLFS